MPGLNESPQYRKFIQARDKALEKILSNSHARITDYTSASLRDIESEILLLLHRRGEAIFPQATRVLLNQLDQRITHSFYYLGILITREINALMRRSYVLGSVGEAEAIARATGASKYQVDGKKANQASQERVQYNLNLSKYKIMKAFEQGLVMDETQSEIMNRVKKSFPELVVYKKPPRVLKVLKESEDGRNKRIDSANGFVSDEDWQDVVHDYMHTYVPQYSQRGADADEEERYGWEIESETNHAFVDQVRSGQNEQAKANGYTDMVWIAILDDRTDECCEWRNGLTSSEIESRLDEDEECDAIVPPAHFNCRCTMAPYTEELGEPEKVDFSDFDEWLKN